MKRISIITGASSGMGVCFARQIALESIKFGIPTDEIWLIARREDKLRETAALIDIPTKIIPLDLSGKDGPVALKALFEKEQKINEVQGGFTINVLVNNAGFGTYGEFACTDTVREMDMVELNCTSLTGITGFALPYMTRGSRIIFTASLASFMPLGNFAVYGATKAYVLSFAVALAAEIKHKGIKVTALCPGPVSTDFANVASNGARAIVKNGLSPEKTVAHCLKCSRKGKLYSMRFFKWRFKANASGFVPRYIGAWFTYKFCKRPSN